MRTLGGLFITLPRVTAGLAALRASIPAQTGRLLGLVAEASADSYALAANGTTTAQYGCAALGLHPGAKTVGLDALTAIGLKCALGHGNALLYSCGNLRLNGKIQVYRRLRQEASGNFEQAGNSRLKLRVKEEKNQAGALW